MPKKSAVNVFGPSFMAAISEQADNHQKVDPPPSGNKPPDVSRRKPPREVVSVPIKEEVGQET